MTWEKMTNGSFTRILRESGDGEELLQTGKSLELHQKDILVEELARRMQEEMVGMVKQYGRKSFSFSHYRILIRINKKSNGKI